jgi:hypothetical protein
MAKGGQINPTMTITAMRATQVTVVLILALAVMSFGGLIKKDIPFLPQSA